MSYFSFEGRVQIHFRLVELVIEILFESQVSLRSLLF